VSIILILALVGFLFALIPAMTFARNYREFARLPRFDPSSPVPPPISVLIPARNEQHSIRRAVGSVLASVGVDLEIIVLDDHSDDATAAIVAEMERDDPRLRLEIAPTLPPGWCGKQHACQVLARLAKHELMVWIDADVRLKPDALAVIAAEMARRPIGLLSGFPREETGTWLEVLLIPLIHFFLLGYLPLHIMRRMNLPALGAGCGQLFIARRRAYESSGGHGEIRSSLHDGISLPRAFRRAGESTDLFDASDLAYCRMYRSAQEVWQGLLKNAGEGMAAPKSIVPWTLLLAGGQLLPPVMALFLIVTRPDRPSDRWAIAINLIATGLILSVRLASAARYRQSWRSALAHPLAIAIFLVIQWQSLILALRGKKRAWKGRTY